MHRDPFRILHQVWIETDKELYIAGKFIENKSRGDEPPDGIPAAVRIEIKTDAPRQGEISSSANGKN